MPGLGDEFRAAREARHLSLADVSEQIHIREVYLQSLENGDPSFAASVYVKGFIRTYARFLGLDSEACVAHFGALGAATPQPLATAPRTPLERDRPGSTPWLWLAGAAAAVLIAFVGFKYVEFERSASVAPASLATPSPVATAASHAPSAHGPALPRAIGKRTLDVRVVQDSWISIKIDGVSRFEGTARAGTVKSYRGKSADVRAGNAGGIELSLDGHALGKMGAPGAVVERTLTLVER
ncbi:MAG: helix-turn-helix domain-containing protein [Vulcanimicrobiaceae bacterium]